MKWYYWVVILGLLIFGFTIFKKDINRQKLSAFLKNKVVQELPNGEFLTIGKTEVFIVSDDKIYAFKKECDAYLKFFREHSYNMPKSVLNRCLSE